jgi:hypothetical protein
MRRSVACLTSCVAGALLLGIASHTSAATPSTKAMVLRLSDLPAGFAVRARVVLTNAKAARERGHPVSRYTRLGRVTGYEITFMRSPTRGSPYDGAAVVLSSASRFATARGAMLGFRDGNADIERSARKDGSKLRRLPVASRIGQETRLYAERATRNGLAEVTFFVAWREGPILSYVLAWGLRGGVEPAQALSLARKQQAHIVRVLR